MKVPAEHQAICPLSGSQLKRYTQNKNKVQLVISCLFLFKVKLFFVWFGLGFVLFCFSEYVLSFFNILGPVEKTAGIHLLVPWRLLAGKPIHLLQIKVFSQRHISGEQILCKENFSLKKLRPGNA